MITSQELKKSYLNFFQERGHSVIPSASLLPENDPTVLFTTAGMHPLVPFLLGEKHPSGKRLASIQKCIRTGDIDEVGDDWHGTFFEMLGNWSLGDYFKQEAIAMSFEFLTKRLGIPLEKLAVSCFEGEAAVNIARDAESATIWQHLGVPVERIAFLGRAENWWGPAGTTGPCGPDTEMFFWASSEPAPKKFDPSDKRWVEIWNDVFMEYNKTVVGRFDPLQQKNVDTGMGLERTVAVLNGFSDVYAIDTYLPVIKKIQTLADPKKSQEQSIRIIADHIRAATFIIGDERGVVPSNVEQGYVLRRLIRRAIRHGRMIGITTDFATEIANCIIDQFANDYPELATNRQKITDELTKEEVKFSKMLGRGLREFEKFAQKTVTGQDAFILFSTYGFPLEMTQELAAERGQRVDEKKFREEFIKHQELSRTATAGKFKGGLADHSTETTRLHTAHHLLLAALQKILGQHVQQKGSNITAERLRIDFSHSEKITPDQLQAVERLVNKKIQADLTVEWEEMPLAEAKQRKATGVFEHKYTEQVKVYKIFDTKTGEIFSQEICGGPHVKKTAELGHFKIQKEEAVSAGIRRIKATVGKA